MVNQICISKASILYNTYLLKVISQFDDGSSLEKTVLVDNQLAMCERVYVAFDQKQIRAALHR